MNQSPHCSLDWLHECPACEFASSDLEPGAGADVQGIELLRRRNFRRILEILDKHLNMTTASALEVGCSVGIFLEEAETFGLQCMAVEPDHAAAAKALDRGYLVAEGYFPQALSKLPEEKFDLIIFNDVFEHLPDIREAKAVVYERLSSDGILVLNLPDSAGFLYQTAKFMAKFGWDEPLNRLWQKGMDSPHLSYFGRENLRKFISADDLFHPIEEHRLESLRVSGLWARLRTGGQSITKSLLLAPPLTCISLAASLLPSDIQLQMFRKAS